MGNLSSSAPSSAPDSSASSTRNSSTVVKPSVKKSRKGTKQKWMNENYYSDDKIEYETASSALDDTTPEKILDLCLIMDCTGSMGSWIAHCKDTLHNVIDDTVAKDKTCKVRVSFVGYRDFCDKRIFAVHEFSYDTDHVKKFIAQQSASGGGDAPEDVQGGLRRALDLNWSGKDDSVKLAYLVADAPCHGKQYHSCADDHPQGNPAGLILEDIVKEFSDREILLTCYKLTDQTEKMYKIIEQAYVQGAEKDGVEFVDIRGQIQTARSHGASLHSEEVRDAYYTGFAESKSCQVSKQRSRKRGW